MARWLGPLLPLILVAPVFADVAVELREGVPEKPVWDFPRTEPVERYTEPAFGFAAIPNRYSDRGLLADRALPVLLSATADITLPAGEYRVVLRSRNGSRLLVDDAVVAQTEFIDKRGDGHESVPEWKPLAPGVRPPALGHRESVKALTLDGKSHRFRLEAFIGGAKLRPEVGELLVAVARSGEPFRLLAAIPSVELSDDGWSAYAAAQHARLHARDEIARKAASAAEDRAWELRHDLAKREVAARPPVAVPPGPAANPIDHFIDRTLTERGAKSAPLCDDEAFLRRATLDTVGLIPTPEEIAAFRRDPDRTRAIDRLLADPRWADHWVGYWQDVLAENPGILKPTLNNTGPFRWWLHQALADNLAMDRFATELVRMGGSKMYGGPAGFGLATENDAPLAAKAHILGQAFLGVEMQCARCHDAPFHPFHQRDLFGVAAMLGRAPIALPKTSTVPMIEGARKPRVTVTLKPGEKVTPAWPFADIAPAELPSGLLPENADSRERLAALLTSPRNDRFAQVLVNRVWRRYLGRGLVEPVDDWDDPKPSHPELLAWLARDFVACGYDLKHVARLILTSQTYQRTVQSGNEASEDRLFASPYRRRLSAEQLVDSLFLAAGKSFGAEELTMDPEGRRPASEMLNLGVPVRAWQFTSLSNERDRPALSLPVAQGIVDLLLAYGWRDARPNPLTVRDETPTPLTPMVLANGVAGGRIVRLSDDSAFTDLCLTEQSLPDLVERLFVRVLGRKATADETRTFVELLKDGYEARRVPVAVAAGKRPSGPASAVSWANHLSPEATRIKLELERRARAGDPPTARLRAEWRERMEDAVWALVNAPEFAFVP